MLQMQKEGRSQQEVDNQFDEYLKVKYIEDREKAKNASNGSSVLGHGNVTRSKWFMTEKELYASINFGLVQK